MRLAEYEAVLRELEPCVSVHPDVDAVVERHPGLTVDAARSIYLQEVTRQLKEREGSYRRASRPARACHTLDPQRVPASPRARTAIDIAPLPPLPAAGAAVLARRRCWPRTPAARMR